MRALPLLIALSLAPLPATAAIHCVKPGGGSGCHPTILAALALADDGDTIRIAAGTYPGSLVITKNITLEGGWNATFTERDPETSYSVVLPTAGSTTSVVSIVGPTGLSNTFTPTLEAMSRGVLNFEG
jgi:nitrous oxidase accessory protein NosD